MRVIGFDHLVVRTTDVERSLAFYTGTLGLAAEGVEEWRAGEASFPSVRIDATTIIDILKVDGRDDRPGNIDHFCLVVEPCDWASEIAAGLPVHRGPVERSGALGDGQSVYIHDPDGNEIELRYY